MNHAANPEILVSVVVIGRNEGERLAQCLDSVANMCRGGFTTETIYVDSGSTDDSLAVAAHFDCVIIPLKPSRPNAAIGRNSGWKAASGSIILFLDGDTILHPRFVLDSLTAFADPKIAIVWGHRREIKPMSSIYNRVLDLDWVYPPGFTPFCGGDALFCREVLERSGGFNESLIAGEEPELCRRIVGLGYSILHVDRPMTGHDLAIHHFSQYWRRAMRAGHAFAEVSSRFANSPEPFWAVECKRNRTRAISILALFALVLGSSVICKTFGPVISAAAILTILGLRSAVKARWKTQDRVALLCYGFHSHLQQIPIFLGQQQFYWNQRRGRPTALVEYKHFE